MPNDHAIGRVAPDASVAGTVPGVKPRKSHADGESDATRSACVSTNSTMLTRPDDDAVAFDGTSMRSTRTSSCSKPGTPSCVLFVLMNPPLQDSAIRCTFGTLPQKSAPIGGGSRQLTVSVAGALVPSAFVAETEYDTGPTCVDVAVQLLPTTAEQFDHWYDDGDCVQLAVSVVVPCAYGSGGLADSVHTGGDVGGTCQLTVTDAVGPTPDALRAVTEYVRGPVAFAVVVHTFDAATQFDHSYAVGVFVHDAVSVSVELIAGELLDGTSTHTGVAFGDGPGGGPDDGCQVTRTVSLLLPALLLARIA